MAMKDGNWQDDLGNYSLLLSRTQSVCLTGSLLPLARPPHLFTSYIKLMTQQQACARWHTLVWDALVSRSWVRRMHQRAKEKWSLPSSSLHSARAIFWLLLFLNSEGAQEITARNVNHSPLLGRAS